MADSAIATIDEFIASEGVDTSGGGWRTKLNTPPQAEFDAESSYFWDLETNVGTISVKLLPETAPMHVSSTIYLTQLGF